jgi:hypothetical protein
MPTGELIQRLAPSPSDSRATFVPGNVTTCSGAGFPGTIQLGAEGNSPASDANVSGTPAPNTGPIQPGQGEEVNVAISGVGVIIDAVVVKGGPAYNLYTNATFLPPTLPPPQHYISPLNGGGNVPDLSHWFVCYHLGTPPPTGSLTVRKVVSVDEKLATPLPTGYSALVNCNDGNLAHQNGTVKLPGGGGGVGTPQLTGIPPGTVHGRRTRHRFVPARHGGQLRPARRGQPARDHRQRRRRRGHDHQRVLQRPTGDGRTPSREDLGAARPWDRDPGALFHPCPVR